MSEWGVTIVGALALGACVFLAKCVIQERRAEGARASKVRVYIERTNNGRYVVRTVDDDSLVRRKGDEHHLEFLTAEAAEKFLNSSNAEVVGIVGEISCIKSSVGEL